jgi:2-iminobutanoate/2-iminopropanoate deaminase
MSGDFPFSSSLKAGKYIFVSGKVGVDPKSGEIQRGDIKAQTEQTLENLNQELQNYGLNLNSVVKTTVFLTDMRNFEAMNSAYKEKFKQKLPARSCVSVTAVPHVDALVEIELIAYLEE